MAVLSRILPQELLDKIVDDLHNDRCSLKRCALASRSLLSRSQSHLFRYIIISTTETSKKVHGVLSMNPVLARYIRILRIRYFSELTDDEDLLIVLRMLTALESFDISSLDMVLWLSIPGDLRDVLLRIFGLESLTTLCISFMYDIPVSFFTVHKALTSLELQSVTFASAPCKATSGMTTKLLKLHLWHPDIFKKQQQLVNGLTQCGFLFSHIKTLELHLHNLRGHFSAVLPILKTAMQSLEVMEFRWVFRDCSGGEGWLPFDFGALPSLRCLAFTLDVAEFHTKTCQIRHLLDFIAVNPSTARIPTLRLIFSGPTIVPNSSASQWKLLPEFLGSSSDWAALDEVLAKERQLSSHALRIEGVLQAYGKSGLSGIPAVAIDAIYRQMPLALKDGMILCELKYSAIF